MQQSPWVNISKGCVSKAYCPTSDSGSVLSPDGAAALRQRNHLLGSEHMPRKIACLRTGHEAPKDSWERSREKRLKLISVISYSRHIRPSNFPCFQTLQIPITRPLAIPLCTELLVEPRSQPCNGSLSLEHCGSDDNKIVESWCSQKPPRHSILFTVPKEEPILKHL